MFARKLWVIEWRPFLAEAARHAYVRGYAHGEPEMSTTVLSVPVEKSIRERLAKLAATTGRTEEDIAAEAIAGAIEASDWHAAAIEKALAEVARGEVISGQAVDDWLASWGTPNELPPPKVGQ